MCEYRRQEKFYHAAVHTSKQNLSRKSCGGQLVHCTHEQVKLPRNLSRKLGRVCGALQPCSRAKLEMRKSIRLISGLNLKAQNVEETELRDFRGDISGLPHMQRV